MTNYKTFSGKIQQAKTVRELEKLDTKLDRLYNAGIFTIREFTRLDVLIVDAKIKLEDNI